MCFHFRLDALSQRSGAFRQREKTHTRAVKLVELLPHLGGESAPNAARTTALTDLLEPETSHGAIESANKPGVISLWFILVEYNHRAVAAKHDASTAQHEPSVRIYVGERNE